jgi:hypothetical protein
MPAPHSIRERLLAAITAAVGGEYGLPAPEDERDLPVTIVQDDADEATTRYDEVQISTPIAIGRAEQALIGDRLQLRQQANEALARLYVAMTADPTFGGLADGVDYVGGGIQAEQGKFVFAEATFRVRWRHLVGNPYLRDPAP